MLVIAKDDHISKNLYVGDSAWQRTLKIPITILREETIDKDYYRGTDSFNATISKECKLL